MVLAKAVRLAYGLCLIQAVTACGDADLMGPRMSDPTGIAVKLDALSDVFHSASFDSYSGLSPSFGPAVTGAPSGGIFPPEALGITYEWNAAGGGYLASERAGAPADGVRFILYVFDVLGGRPVDPLAEMGHAELTDVSAETPQLRVVVATDASTDANYTIGATASTWAAAGDLSAGATKLAFDGTLSSTGLASSSIDVGFVHEAEGLGIRLGYEYVFDYAWQRFTVDFRLQLAADVVRVAGSGEFNIGAGSGGGRLAVTLNDQEFATVEIDADGMETYRGDLTPDERLALDAIRRSIFELRTGFGRLITTATPLLVLSPPAAALRHERAAP